MKWRMSLLDIVYFNLLFNTFLYLVKAYWFFHLLKHFTKLLSVIKWNQTFYNNTPLSDKVKALFQSIDYSLYQDGDQEQDRPDTSDSFRSFQPCLSEDLQQECAIWREKFPHLRFFLYLDLYFHCILNKPHKRLILETTKTLLFVMYFRCLIWKEI